MEPRFPVYIPSKSRAEVATTPRVLTEMGVPFRIIVEEQQVDDYARFFPPEVLLTLDPEFQRNYEALDDIGLSKSMGPGPARNFAWEHSISEGAEWHWVMDDNILHFGRLHQNRRIRVGDGLCFHAMEEFSLRYSNIGMSGPHYWSFAPARSKLPPFITGTRVYSCNLIRNDLPQRWRGRYNEDTILSLDMLKAGWNTVQFYAFLQNKLRTQVMKGGNTEAFYAKEGTFLKSDMLVKAHPDVARHVRRYGRDHHYVDYDRWRNSPLIPRDDYEAKPDLYRMRLESTGKVSKRRKRSGDGEG